MIIRRYPSSDPYCHRVIRAMIGRGFNHAANEIAYRWDDYSLRDIMLICRAWGIQ